MATTLHHWKAGDARGHRGRFSGRDQSGDGRHRPAGAGQRGGRQRGGGSRSGGFSQLARHLAGGGPGPFAFRELLNERKKELAAIITSEHGKVLSDALGGEPGPGGGGVRMRDRSPDQGDFTENASTRSTCTPPANHLAWRASSRRSTSRPWCRCGSSHRHRGGQYGRAEAEREGTDCGAVDGRAVEGAGLPDGVFNVLNGDKVAVDRLLTHPDVQSISFVGSTPIARYVYETGTTHGKRVQALGGAKNHMLVLPDADLDLAADQAINAGSGRRGSAAWRSPRCWPSAISVTSWWPRSGTVP